MSTIQSINPSKCVPLVEQSCATEEELRATSTDCSDRKPTVEKKVESLASSSLDSLETRPSPSYAKLRFTHNHSSEALHHKILFEGLSQAIEETFPNELLSGAYFIFLNRRRNLMKIMHWDLEGFVIWYKRLEEGSFPLGSLGNSSITKREVFCLLEGIKPKRLNPRFSLK